MFNQVELQKKLEECLLLARSNNTIYRNTLDSLSVINDLDNDRNDRNKKNNKEHQTMLELPNGAKVWVLNPEELCTNDFDWDEAKFHRENDLPAVEFPSGEKRWYKNGKIHRENDKPTVIYPDGKKEWWKEGKLHRENDLPAIEYSNGTKYWYKNGKIHRENDKPAVIYLDGTKEWWKEGKIHRENDKPAIEHSDGSKEWYKEGKRHRENGPCLTYCGWKERKNVEGKSTMLELPTGTKVWVMNPEELDPKNFDWLRAILHRENNKPAVEFPSGEKRWYKENKLHRENGKPAIIWNNGSKEYWINGKRIK